MELYGKDVGNAHFPKFRKFASLDSANRKPFTCRFARLQFMGCSFYCRVFVDGDSAVGSRRQRSLDEGMGVKVFSDLADRVLTSSLDHQLKSYQNRGRPMGSRWHDVAHAWGSSITCQ